MKKSSAGVISTDNSCDLNIKFGDTSGLLDPENNRNILFTYFSPDINENLLSSFTGPFIAENTNNNILMNEQSQHCCNKKFETPDTFLLVPRPSAPSHFVFFRVFFHLGLDERCSFLN